MARRNNRDRVLAIRRTHCTHCARVADLLGNLAIAARFAKRNGQQGLPHLFLKVRPGEIQFQVEAVSCAGEVFLQLLSRAHQDRVVRRLTHRPEPYAIRFVVFPEDGRQSRTVRNQLQLADRRRHGGEGVTHAGGLRKQVSRRQAYCLDGEAQYAIPTILRTALETFSLFFYRP